MFLRKYFPYFRIVLSKALLSNLPFWQLKSIAFQVDPYGMDPNPPGKYDGFETLGHLRS